jgi:2-keto-4-pentenoate hydratase/2-oxohepta-3-ene-1,7-dioic acid hydratase in catechol pathway
VKLAYIDDRAPAVVLDGRLVGLGPYLAEASWADRHSLSALVTRLDDIDESWDAIVAAPGIALDDALLGVPVGKPSKVLCAQGNYREGLSEGSLPLNMFLKAPSSLLPPGGTVILPPDDAVIFHHEAELAVVIGERAHGVSESDAMRYVLGYTCFIDVSARGLGTGLDIISKSQDTFGPIGPWITTKDEVEDPHGLDVRLWVNGQLRQDYNTSDMEHRVEAMIAWASRLVTLEIGDVLTCGTNHQGLGPLQHGDRVKMEIGGLGALEVSVEDPLRREWPDRIDTGIGAAIKKMRLTGEFSGSSAFSMHPRHWSDADPPRQDAPLMHSTKSRG